MKDKFKFIPQPSEVITQIDSVTNMEALEINNGNGQSYGTIVYRKQIDLPAPAAELKISGRIRDVAMVVVDNAQLTKRPESQAALLGFGYWSVKYENYREANQIKNWENEIKINIFKFLSLWGEKTSFIFM
jgi:hypothetical protein